MILDHLWQSTLCVGLAALVAAALGRHAARLRYRVWLIASLKFLLPFSVLIAAGRNVPLPAASELSAIQVPTAVRAIGEPFSEWQLARIVPDPTPSAPRNTWVFPALLLLWATGSAFVVWSRWARWRALRPIVREAQPMTNSRERDAVQRAHAALQFGSRIEVLLSAVPLEPGVFGILKPVILWPAGLSHRLSDHQLDAVLMHELSHVQRRDNLTSAVQLLVESIFWFHPLVWWMGSRLVRERERACDETVLHLGGEPGLYAESILKVCEYCLRSPLVCAVGAAGKHLKERVEDIMTAHVIQTLSRRRRVLLALMAGAVFAAPIVMGAISVDRTVTPGRAQSPDVLADRAVASTIATAEPNPPAQAGAGRIGGIVRDSTGLLIPGATVTVRSATGEAYTTVTDVAGHYAVANLGPGPYSVQIQLAGFRTSRGTLQIGAGAQVIFDTQLEVGGLSETITIAPPVGLQPPIEAQQSQANNARFASTYFDLAKRFYEQGRLADSEAMLRRALDLLQERPAATETFVQTASTSVGGDITEPKKIRHVRPIYPVAAVAGQDSGIVILEAIVAKDGTVKDVRVLRSAPIFDDAALAAVRQWLFTPTLLNGVPIDVVMTVTVNFPAR